MWKSIYLLLVLSFVLSGQSQTVSPQNTQVAFQLSQFGTVAGTPIIAIIQPRDANNNSITGCVLGVNPFTASSPSPNLDIIYPDVCQPSVQFPYVITLVSNNAGNYSVSFSYQNQIVGQSPYTIGFTFGSISPNNSVAFGPGLINATVGQTATFFFKTYDQHNNFIFQCLPSSSWSDFTILLTQPTNIVGQVTSCDNSTFIYTATYETDSTDSGFLYVRYFGNNFNQMPRTPEIYSGPPYGPTCTIPVSSLNNVTQAGVAATFVLECVDQFGNSISDCGHYSLNNWAAFFQSLQTPFSFYASSVACSGQGIYTFTYSSTVASLYNTSVYYSSPSNAAPSFTTLIKPGPPSNVKAFGAGVSYNDSSNIAGQPSFFSIFMADVYGNRISECLNSTDNDWDISVNPQMVVPPQVPQCVNGAMVSNWTATNSLLNYYVSVAYDGTQAEGSPYETNVFSNVLAPGQTVLQQLQITQVGAGLSLPFSIKGYDAYSNPIVNCSRVTTSQFTVKATNLGNTSIQLSGSVTCTQLAGTVNLSGTIYGTLIGTYSLQVTYNGTQLQNSPQTFVVLPGPMDPTLTYATGAGFTNPTQVVAGTSNIFNINQKDQYGNVISQCLGLGYAWNVILSQGPPTRNVMNQTTVGFCNSQGVYSISLTITQTGSFQIQVYSVYNQNYTGETPIHNQGAITVIPGPFFATTSVVTVAPTAEVGDQVGVTVVPYDQYGNPIGQCANTVALDLEIFARLNGAIYATGNLTCGTLNNYVGTYLANSTGTYYVDVGYQIGGLYYPVGNQGDTHVLFGAFNATYSTASGPGVGTNNANVTAGTYAMIYITTRNKNGFVIPSTSVDLSHFSFNINGINNTDVQITNARVNGTLDGFVVADYNGTNAQYYSVMINYNQTLVSGHSYVSQIVASTIDINTLQASNVTSDDSGIGSFDLTATDAFGNPVVISGIEVTLSPSCAYPNVSCSNVGDDFTCQFSVLEAGVYCISVFNSTSLTQHSVDNSTILVSGGNGCDDNDFCNSNGVCFQSQSAPYSYKCNCKNGYTGNNCETKIKSHYMNLWLGIGLLIGLSLLLLIIGVVLGCLLGRRNREMSINR